MTNETKEKKQKETEIIRSALKKSFESLDEKTAKMATRETMIAPNNRVININGQKLTASELRFHVAETIEAMGNGNTTANATAVEHAHDLQMMIAHSIETINSETSSSQEYFRWLDDASDIIKNMNDGYVSEADLEQRNDFLNMSHQREAELLVCLSLYSNSNNPIAEQRANEIRYKLTKLREMRSAIETTTQNKADEPVTREEYEKAIPYYKLYKGLATMPFGYDISQEQKQALGINHDKDQDLNNKDTLFDKMLNTVLDDLRMQDNFQYTTALSRLSRGIGEQETDPKNIDKSAKFEQISDKLKELTGRKQTFSINYALLEAQKRHGRA